MSAPRCMIHLADITLVYREAMELLLFVMVWCKPRCKTWGVKMTPVGVNRGPHPQVLKLDPRV